MRRGALIALVLGAAGPLAASPATASTRAATASRRAATASPRPAAASTRAASATQYRLVQYPGVGFGGFYAQIGRARSSIDMEMYELADPTAERDLASAAARGVRVRVLLDRDYSGAYVNRAAYGYLRRHGVAVRWAPAHYIFHIKATVFDGTTADVSTANLTARYYADTRDAELIDTDPGQVRAIARTLANDWRAAPGGAPRDQTVQAPGLVWSPVTAGASAEAALVARIGAARHSIEFESEELSDPAVYDALAADARRGVRCRVVMNADSEWDRAFAVLRRAGCQVHTVSEGEGTLYIHEKLILDDLGSVRQSLLIGSQNASWESLHENRELSVLVTDAGGGRAAIQTAGAAFAADFSGSTG